MRLRAHQRTFRSPFGNLRAPKLARNPWDTKSHSPARVNAPSPQQRIFLRHSCRTLMQAGGLSSGQTIGAARTAVRSACCLPELRVISAFGGQPTGLIFPSVPPCTPSVSPTEKSPYAKFHPRAGVGASIPNGVIFTAKLAFSVACRGAFKPSNRNRQKAHPCRNQHELPLK